MFRLSFGSDRRHVRRTVLVLGTSALTSVALFACESDEMIPTRNARFGDKVSTGGSAGTTNSGAPQIVAVSPASGPSADTVNGPWGIEVTIAGSALGGGNPRLSFTSGTQITPGDAEVVSWSDDTIRVKMPFPAEGEVSFESDADGGTTLPAFTFVPTWETVGKYEASTAVEVQSAVSHAPGELTIMLSGAAPATVLMLDGSSFRVESIPFGASSPTERRLYLKSDGDVAAFGLSDDATPVLLSAARDAGTWTVTPSVTLSSEVVVAGGRSGGVVWFHTTGDSWSRAYSKTGTWDTSKPLVTDPNPSATNHAVGTTSDGALYVAYTVMSSGMETPTLRRLSPNASSFSAAVDGGSSSENAITSLELLDHGDGIVVHTCTDFSCTDGLYPSNRGSGLDAYAHPDGGSYAFSTNSIASLACSDDGNLTRTVDDDSSNSEAVAWPCPTLLAHELDENGQSVALVRVGNQLRVLRPRAADPSGAGGAGGAGGSGS
jgi:hypothetical protein